MASATTEIPPPQAPLPYIELKPLPAPMEQYPTVMKVLKLAAIVLLSIALFAWVGFALTLLVGSSLKVGLICGGFVGAIAGGYFGWTIPTNTKTDQYRLATLKQLRPLFESDPRALEIFKRMQTNWFAKGLNRFEQTYHNTLLHKDLTVITEKAKTNRSDVQRVWKIFLDNLHGQEVVNADQRVVTLDLSYELLRLEGQMPQMESQVYAHPNLPPDEELDQIAAIQDVCFGQPYVATKAFLKQKLSESDQTLCIVIKDPDRNKVVGFAYTCLINGELTLGGIARDPGAVCKMPGPAGQPDISMGKHLIEEIQKRMIPEQVLRLHVRESNYSAIGLYQRCGFQLGEKVEDYYKKHPAEGAYPMVYQKPAAQLLAQTGA